MQRTANRVEERCLQTQAQKKKSQPNGNNSNLFINLPFASCVRQQSFSTRLLPVYVRATFSLICLVCNAYNDSVESVIRIYGRNHFTNYSFDDKLNGDNPISVFFLLFSTLCRCVVCVTTRFVPDPSVDSLSLSFTHTPTYAIPHVPCVASLLSLSSQARPKGNTRVIMRDQIAEIWQKSQSCVFVCYSYSSCLTVWRLDLLEMWQTLMFHVFIYSSSVFRLFFFAGLLHSFAFTIP